MINVGDKAPEVLGINEKGEEIRLSAYKGKKIVLYFYPKDSTSGCTAQACNLRDNYSELRKAGYEVIGVSVDNEKSHQKFIEKNNLPFTLIADTDKKLVEEFGEWKIKEVNGEAIPSGMEKQPFIAFDVKKKTIHGNAGCNLINGGFETSTSNAKSISFPGVASTMMACPDMETEGKVLKAINEVKSFDVLSGGGIGLYDANGALVIVLEK